ncbi:MAG: cytochrome c/FTR1 family iron permease [Pseudomonadota bacterium]|nr:cytochrome c/FTR1 family iron permease [Pseudomonadota bacterium]
MPLCRFLFVLLLATLLPGAASAQVSDVPTMWRLLDYIAVDYRGAVADGKIVSELEYAEMTEFSASVKTKLATLPAGPARAKLLQDATALEAAIAAKAAPDAVDRRARALATALLKAHPVALAPAAIPDLGRGAKLYADNCASCHGSIGDATGALSAGMDPPPIAFTDRARAQERSLFALYQVIDQGLEGTAMQSFAALPSADKWALAFYTGRFAYPPALTAEGKRIWDGDSALRTRIGDLAALTSLTPAALAAQIGPDKATPVMAYLRGNPLAVSATGSATLDIARDKLRQSLAAYEGGDRKRAEQLALAAYLDGFEPVEPILSARDGALMQRVERAMAQLRAAIGRERPIDEVRARITELSALFDETEAALAPDSASGASTFIAAFTILLREGLEALLIVVAMLTFLRKADRPEMLRPVHYGWIAAIVAGVATWWAATHFITVSGADRELTEGFGSLLAALILLFVGIWMHGKAQADEWQRYIKAKMGRALTGRSGWFLFALAFIAVYREVFETIIFYTALSAQGGQAALAGGAALAILFLVGIAVAMFRFSRRLPITKFFAYSSALIAVLAVVLAGKGIAALQEAGMIGVTPLPWVPSLPLLGISPTLEAVLAQLATLLILLVGFGHNKREGRRLAVA